ncbi:ATPase [Sunxiuqinia sp. sy24]|uniref:ATPase n=1 Tax=Sunxiuqinia sp. sy24 TaxID=3461495 RepID=UPI0040466332
MSILIADSGSTKTDWLLTGVSEGTLSFQTKGINPFFRTSEDIYEELRDKLLLPAGCTLTKIYFYGAGIVNQERGDVIRTALNQLYPNVPAETHSDILGASRALFGSEAGIACIVGTGSNTCLYDGERIMTRVPPLGFILGDEFSGAVLGRKLLGDFFKNIMPIDVQNLFRQEFILTEAEVLNAVYRTERPNKYLAGFAPFLSKNSHKLYCQELITSSAKEFFDRNILQIPEANQFSLGFVGSVAWNFKETVEELAAQYHFQKPFILKGPIEKLKEYHERSGE